MLRSKRNLVSELSGPSELWWGSLRWGGSSEVGGRLADNIIGEEIPPFPLRIFKPAFLQYEVFKICTDTRTTPASSSCMCLGLRWSVHGSLARTAFGLGGVGTD